MLEMVESNTQKPQKLMIMEFILNNSHVFEYSSNPPNNYVEILLLYFSDEKENLLIDYYNSINRICCY